jgi:hypothetical protein
MTWTGVLAGLPGGDCWISELTPPGFQQFGQIPNFSGRHTRHCLTKDL